MIKVTPMDQELAKGHAGRIAWVNAMDSNQAEFDRLIAASSHLSSQVPCEGRSWLSQLASLSAMTETEYARKHSMLPAFRVAANHGEDLIHGDAQGESFSRHLGMRTQKPGAYLCKACVKVDLEKKQLSWYRREHHLYGIDWCSTHEQPLFRVTAPNPWSVLPQHWVEDAQLEVENTDIPEESDMVFLRRYAEIAETLLERGRPLDVRVMGYLMRKRAQNLGFRTSVNGQRSTISDYIGRHAPAQWLKTHYNHIATKGKTGFLTKIDAAVISRTIPAQGHVYGLVLASLFDTAQEAMRYLDTSVPPEVTQDFKTPMRRDSKFWHGEFWEIYEKFDGQTTEIAESLGMYHQYLQEKMTTLGMPSLHNVTFSRSWRALVRLHKGESFRRSCELEHVDERELEFLLRTVNPKVVNVVRRILEDGSTEKRFVSQKLPRHQQLSGCDAVGTSVQKPIGRKSQLVVDSTAFGISKCSNSLREMKAA